VVALAQDKRQQRERLAALGAPSPPFQAPVDRGGLLAFAERHGWPIVAKACRGGYDGRGVWVLDGPPAAERLAAQAAAEGVELLVEGWVPIERELAVLVAANPSGQRRTYPLVQTVQQRGICREVLAPAPVPPALAEQARALALEIAAASGVVGILAVELFEAGGRLLVNELAARPHNSGHYSIEGCVASQFENHLRGVLDWPLGRTELVAPAVATVNVLGVEGHDDLSASLPAALAVEGAHVHLYGKRARPGRKLAHVTTVGTEPGEVLARARLAAALLVTPPGEEVKA
jgi:5-(carboxyamino)imidazole ribonucleotide synthase